MLNDSRIHFTINMIDKFYYFDLVKALLKFESLGDVTLHDYLLDLPMPQLIFG